MIRTFVFLAVVCAAPAFTQVARQSQNPDSILFQAFFRQVLQTEDAAATLRAKGRTDAAARDYYRKRADLSASEDSLLKEIARSCTAEYQAESQRGLAVVQSLRAQNVNKSTVPPEVERQINSLEEGRNLVTAKCVDRLRAAMGSRFEKLDAFVRQTVGPTIRHTDSEKRQ